MVLVHQLNAVRDAAIVERLLVANSRTHADEIDAGDYPNPTILSSKLIALRHGNKPFVVRQGGKDWKVVKRWGDPATLLAQAKLEEDEFPNRRYTVYIPEADGHLNQSHAAPFGFMTFHKYLQTGRRHRLYMLGVPDKAGRGASPFEVKKGESTPPIFAQDIDEDDGPKLFTDLFKGALATRRHVFFNSAYSFTNLHYDTDWNTYLCVLGKRCWTLAHPDHAPLLGAAGGGANYSLLRPTKGPDGIDSSRLAHLVKFVRIELNAGDVLCVPPTWWHVVEGLSDGFSCGINWFNTFPSIDTRSPLDVGWEWTHAARKRLIVKPSAMMGMSAVQTASIASDDEEYEDVVQPEGASDGLQLCSDPKFVSKIATEIEGIYGSIPAVFSNIEYRLVDTAPDHMLARQLVRIAVNTCKTDKAGKDQFAGLCDSISDILMRRELWLIDNVPKKRKRKPA